MEAPEDRMRSRIESGGRPHSRLLTVLEAASRLGLSRWTVRRLIDAGALPVVRFGTDQRRVRRLLIDAADIEKLIESSKEREQ